MGPLPNRTGNLSRCVSFALRILIDLGPLPLLLLAHLGCQEQGEKKATPSSPNILLVSLDTVRADRLSLYGHSRPTSPNLSRLAKRGETFTLAFSQGNESLYSHASLFTGLQPSQVAAPVYANFVVPEEAVTVAEILTDHGYQSAAFTAGGHVVAEFGFSQGFQTFHVPSGMDYLFSSLANTVPAALEWLDGRDPTRPFFLFVHGYDAHAPYQAPGPFAHLFDPHPSSELADSILATPVGTEKVASRLFFPRWQPENLLHGVGRPILGTGFYADLAQAAPEEAVALSEADVAHLLAHYDSSVAFGDWMLGRLLAGISHRGLETNTVILVVSDHGEDLLDHGFMNHRTSLTDSTTRVPMVVAGPGFAKGKEQRGLVEALDALPTLMRVAGLAPLPSARGKALQDDLPEARLVFQEGVMDMVAVRTPTHRLVFGGVPLADPEFIHRLQSLPLTAEHFAFYETLHDPLEKVNLLALSQDPSPVAVSLRNHLVEWRRSLVPGPTGGGESVPSPLRDALRQQGYWDPHPSPPTPEKTPAPTP